MNRSKASTAAMVAACLLIQLGGCGGGGSGPSTSAPVSPAPLPPPPSPSPPPPPPPPASVERDINPALTNSALTLNLSPHFVVNPAANVAPAQRLFVMLPGTGGVPRFYREIVRAGAVRGYHAIGLTYPNDQAIGDLCAGSQDTDCAGRARLEVITGQNTSVLVNVDADNSIDRRLRALLVYLQTAYPSEGWEKYLIGGEVDWSRVTLAGHSQGAGHAAYSGKLRRLNRIVMFSGPGDVGVTPGSPALWMSLPNLTPASQQFGFVHTADPLTPVGLVSRNWDLLGLGDFGPAISVDGAGPPFQGSHKLLTSAPPDPNPLAIASSPPHGAPALDVATPRDAQGAPLYLPVWTYLAFP
jgi:hypothetical protein